MISIDDIRNLSVISVIKIRDDLLLERERRSYRKLIHFVQGAWEILEPSEPYRHNWHIDTICDHLEAVSRGEIKNLLINVPPGAMKSLLVSVIWPAWEWSQNKSLRYFCASYSEDISIRDNLKCRDIIKSTWYQRLWPDVQVRRDSDQKSQYMIIGGGGRIASSVGGRGTGHHPDRKIVDDPHNVRQSESDTERNNAISWFDRTLSSRGASRNSATVVIMQRLHELDLSGHIAAREDYEEDWVHLVIPMEYDGDRSRSPLGRVDPRKKDGELLWPSLYSEKVVKTLKIGLGAYGVAGQLQQRPAPSGGGIIKRDHFKLWPATRATPDLIYVIQSYDTAFTENTSNDPTACTTWGLFEDKGAVSVILLDAWSDYLEYPDLRRKIISEWNATYGGVLNDPMRPSRRADIVLIEEKGSGISLIQDLRQARIPVRTYNPGRADKISRAHQITPFLDMGSVYILESKKDIGEPITWARDHVKQCEQFPNGAHDDSVDTMTQCLIYLRDSNLLKLPECIMDEEEIDYHARRKAKKNPYS